MNQVRKSPAAAKVSAAKPLKPHAPPQFVARRKHPWLLAALVVSLTAWLIFLVYLADR